jgi:hypothetical protein
MYSPWRGRFEKEGWRLRKGWNALLGQRYHRRHLEDGKLIGFAKITRDITEKRQAQQALEHAQLELFSRHKKRRLPGRLPVVSRTPSTIS